MANTLQNTCKIIGFKQNMVYKIPPGAEVMGVGEGRGGKPYLARALV